MKINLKMDMDMFFGQELATESVGCYCTVLNSRRGYAEGQVICDYGNEIVVRLNNGRKVMKNRDDVLIYND